MQKNANDAASAVEFEMNRRSGLFGIMFPGKFLKEHEQLAIQNMKDVFQSRQELMQVYLNVQIELTKNQGQMIIKSKLQYYEGELSQKAMQIKTDLMKFAEAKKNEISSVLERSRIDFMERMDRQDKEVEKYKHNARLYKRMKKSLNNEMEIFISTIDELLKGFKKSLDDKLNQG